MGRRQGLDQSHHLGWWWADPAAALVLAVLAVKEGRAAWRGDLCCAPGPSTGCADGCCG